MAKYDRAILSGNIKIKSQKFNLVLEILIEENDNLESVLTKARRDVARFSDNDDDDD